MTVGDDVGGVPPQQPGPRVEIFSSAEELATSVAGALLGRLAELQQGGVVPQVALTGGTIADLVHREIARHANGEVDDVRRVDWSRVAVWWGDERFVPSGSPERNAGRARAALLDAVGATRVFEVPAADRVPDAETAAEQYAAALEEHGGDGFDILMLGVGPDGHVASLFPGHPALDCADRLVVAVHDSPKPPPDRVTLTFPALNRARSVWFLVSGEAKADAVARALADVDGVAPEDVAPVAETPARGVLGRDETIWFLDSAAASRL